MADQLPDNDKDLKLAREIGTALKDGEVNVISSSDPFLNQLVNYKVIREESTSSTTKNINSSALWNQIASETKRRNHNENEEAKIHALFTKNKAIWATAASVLIAVLASIFYYTSQPTLIASSGQKLETVMLEDGSTVTLRPHSQIYTLSKSPEEIAFRLQGEGFFEVEKKSDRTFSVEAGSGKVSVLGTRFNLSSWGNQTQVYLEEGLIVFENTSTNDSVRLDPGQSAQIESDTLLSTSISAPAEYTDWMNQELIFRNRTARYVFNELEQEFNITINAPKFIKNTSLTGGLSLKDTEQSLQDLALVLDGEFKKINKNTYNFVPNR